MVTTHQILEDWPDATLGNAHCAKRMRRGYRSRAPPPPASVGGGVALLPLAHTMPVWYPRHQGRTDSAARAAAAGTQALPLPAPPLRPTPCGSVGPAPARWNHASAGGAGRGPRP